MARKLKVYRTPIGFHDAYVAATSQKAALKAWGADVDLFARGVAEAVTDATLTAEPLDKPGTVVRRPRGTSEEHMAALPEDQPGRRKTAPQSGDEDGPPPRPRRSNAGALSRTVGRDTIPTEKKSSAPTARAKPRSKPRPSRGRLDEAEQALGLARKDHEQAVAQIRQQEKALQQRRREMEQRHERDLERLEAMVAKAQTSYGAALEKWRGEGA